jgi:hypothetical protein
VLRGFGLPGHGSPIGAVVPGRGEVLASLFVEEQVAPVSEWKPARVTQALETFPQTASSAHPAQLRGTGGTPAGRPGWGLPPACVWALGPGANFARKDSEMRTRQVGYTDLHISVVGLGSFAVGGGGWRFSWGPHDSV